MRIELPEFSLIVLVGASGSGKSTFARQHFLPTEIVSSDACRGMIIDDENSMEINTETFDLMRIIVAKRLAAKRLTVIDATNVQHDSRKPWLALAKEFHCLPIVMAFNLPEKICQERNNKRPDRQLPKHVVRNHNRALRSSLRRFKKEGFRYIHKLNTPEEVEAVSFERQKLWVDKREETGPFDIIGDIHGCYDELEKLLTKLGYDIQEEATESGVKFAVQTPPDRKAFFVGDLVDRGPDSPRALRLVMDMVEAGQALCVPGNHDVKFMRFLNGKKVQQTHGLAETVAQMELEPLEFHQRVKLFLRSLVSHYVLDGGQLVVAHAGLREDLQGRVSGVVRSFSLYGETTGETDDFGLPIRHNWAADYRGKAQVVYGHTPVLEAEWLNQTLCIDTGCVFGGKLTALRYPEKDIVEVPAAKVYCEPIRPLASESETARSAQQEHDDLLYIEDVQGRRHIHTRLRGNITVQEDNATAALEIMSRFTVDPRWLIYLPPTMSPTSTSQKDGYLEHPEEAFAYYRKNKVQQVICEEKHMGSRAVFVICQEPEVAMTRFGLPEPSHGVCYTRTGRPFFSDKALMSSLLQRMKQTLDQAGAWDKFNTSWICLDAEVMPWSAKAQALLQQQYAPVGQAATMALDATYQVLQQAIERGLPLEELSNKMPERQQCVAKFKQAYEQYCWPVTSLDDYRIAPFHILATEGAVHTEQPHTWHMDTIASWCKHDVIWHATPYKMVDLNDEGQCEEAIQWWELRTQEGSEGMVVKPDTFLAFKGRQLLQPAVKCRGPEYLRIVYGPEYSLPEHIERLRQRGLSRKRSLALREFSLGIEALQRFVEKRPLRSIHECVFGVLALESEGVDPRL